MYKIRWLRPSASDHHDPRLEFLTPEGALTYLRKHGVLLPPDDTPAHRFLHDEATGEVRAWRVGPRERGSYVVARLELASGP